MPTSGERSDAFEDRHFLDRLRAGEDLAFEELLRVAGPRLLAVARRMMHNEDDAREALQDAMLSAFKGIGSFDGSAQLTTWLHRIVVNACLMKLRSRRRRPEVSIDAFMPGFLPDGHRADPSPAWQPPPASGIERAETTSVVRRAIDELPGGYREVLLMRDIEGLSTEQTAELLEMSTSAVKTRLHRARMALRELLDPAMQEARI